MLPLIETGGTGPILLGRNWLSSLSLNWKEIFTIRTCKSLFDVLDSYSDMFAGLGTVQGVTAAINVNQSATPRYFKARPLPYTLKSKVEELERLEQQGVIEPVQFADWAAPIVPDGSIRICGDYKVTVNQAISTRYHELMTSLLLYLVGGSTRNCICISASPTGQSLSPICGNQYTQRGYSDITGYLSGYLPPPSSSTDYGDQECVYTSTTF